MASVDLSTISPTVNAGVGLQPRIQIQRKTDSTDVAPGGIVQSKSVSDNDVLLSAVADPADWDGAVHRPLGVVYEVGDLDLDTAFAAGVLVDISLLGSLDIVYVEVVENGGDLIEGDKLYISATAGLAAKMIIANAAAPTADEGLFHHRGYVGMVLEFSADSANTRWVKTLLN